MPREILTLEALKLIQLADDLRRLYELEGYAPARVFARQLEERAKKLIEDGLTE